MKMKFHITYDVTTEESARQGDHAYNGFVTKYGECPRKRDYIPKNPAEFTLREAVEILENHNSGHEPLETDSWPVSAEFPPRWVTVSDNPGYVPDEGITRMSLHFNGCTPSSAMRLYRLLAES